MKKFLSMIFGFAIVGTSGWFLYWLISQIWAQFKLLDPKVSVAILTAATTVLVATLTVVLGKFYERKKDIEAHYREKKTAIYDEFLCEFFKIFHSNENDENEENTDLVNFLREWQRKMILWGGQEVLVKYIVWMKNLKQGNPTAQSMFLMEDFFLEIRKDLGHKNNKLVKGTFIHLILRDSDLFLLMAKENPNLSLAELTEAERKLHN